MTSIRYSIKFYVGIALVIVSLIVGKITTITFFLYLNDTFIRTISMVLYILSWPALIVGAIWIGREYAHAIKKYASYQFYGQSLKKGTQKALSKTKQIHEQVREQVKTKISQVRKIRGGK